MPRSLNLAEHTVKREAFVDAGLRLMQASGYERMSVQDVLDAVDVSRGAFYHYFDSKQALLEAMVERIADQALANLAPVVEDGELPALRKLERFFGGLAQFKAERKALMLEFIKVWLSDDNAVVREKVRRTTVVKITPFLARIVKQGIDEGVFAVKSPAETAAVLMTLMAGLQEIATELFIARQASSVTFETVTRTFDGYREAFERILGAPAGSISLAGQPVLREWFG